MSVIRKKPFIETTIEKLSAEELASLRTLLNSNATAIVNAEFGNLPETAITPVYFHFQEGFEKTGILLKNATTLVLICYNTKYEDLELFELDGSNYKANKIYEVCTINELRRVLDDTQEHGGDAWVETMKDKIVYDAENNEIQCGVHFYADGDLETGADVVVGRDLIVDTLQNLQDPNGYPFIPDNMGHAGEFLKAGTTGLVWDTPFVNNNKVVAVSEADWESYVPQTNIVYVVYNPTTHQCTTYFYTE